MPLLSSFVMLGKVTHFKDENKFFGNLDINYIYLMRFCVCVCVCVWGLNNLIFAKIIEKWQAYNKDYGKFCTYDYYAFQQNNSWNNSNNLPSIMHVVAVSPFLKWTVYWFYKDTKDTKIQQNIFQRMSLCSHPTTSFTGFTCVRYSYKL